MHMVGHQGAGVPGVAVFSDYPAEDLAEVGWIGLRPWWSSPRAAIFSTRIVCEELPQGSLGSHQPQGVEMRW